ncbi:LOW QUALITY PROTEIN: multidrug resistance-associated protein 5 [Coccidioides immitis RMSCC 3703]|uniref:Multidrug resistance-associated protein 5 n=1 Tax=Coccidioides immitis RMSCC 3703 TaxID=454286 RepID=A0A0J8U1V2_COCIT|nr:LOW QUALITY PROTEIN: multidrug resistance-associated protein 5 [Coccidioides immitis RMSCC 3703]
MDNALELKMRHSRCPLIQTRARKPTEKGVRKENITARCHQLPLEESGQGTDSGTKSPSEPFKLSDLNFTAGRNELLAVIGTVGSGKTSLLAAIAGDMRLTGGEVTMGASRAFCPQYAWIQNATLKENILFGKEYDKVWYDEVIEACALRADLEMLPAGDKTEIGERGITISGGQKQRLNIARAIYFNADLVLMDDPLSAVDAHLHVLNRCDRIILMNDGRIESVDTFDNLMRDSELFQRLMATTSQEEEKENEKKENDEIEEEEKPDEKTKSSKQPAMLMQQEERAVDSVSWKVWWAYISSFGWPTNFPLIVIFLLLCNGANIVTSLWLSYWTSDKFNLPQGEYMGIYAALGASQAILMYGFSTILTTSGTNASKSMLQKAMTRVLRAPMSFFDTTPLGRITNRFSKDIHTMDNDLCDAMRIYYLTFTMIISVMVLIIVFYHFFAVALVPLLVLFLLAANFYRASAREMKRHEAVLRSVVFAQFGEAVSGTASIRAYGLQDHFIKRIRAAIDNMNSAYFLTFSNQRWLSIRLDAVGCLMVFVTGILVVTSRFDVEPSISGLVLSYILAIFQMLQFTVRQLAEVENNMNATERIHYYGTQLEEEAPLHMRELDKTWPSRGEITFSNVQMRYREGLPLVLQGLNMKIQGGERIGIVGRTGAGKSSIMSALFRLTELSGGSIEIDGIDISTIGLHDLRSRLAIIPQDPTLFRGTVRSNLDPFNQYSDLELWSALRKADLVGEGPTSNEQEPAETAKNANQPQQRIHLDSPVEEEGLNFSLGQRQLMALARALVRDSRIIVCDEATSSVDFETDQKIQKTMAQGFEGKTLLCIAHRLRTIINYDRICVMAQGRIAEFDTPLALWEMGGIFRGMCDRSGIIRDDFFAQ